MMANLGGFAGGLASGYMAGEKMKMAQQELEDSRNFRERQVKMQEEDQEWKRLDRTKMDEANTAFQELYKERYGGDIKPGMNPSHDAQFYVDSTAMMMMKTGKYNPELLAKAAQTVNEVKQTEQGRTFFGAIAGDEQARAKLAQQAGLDPANLKFVRDGGGRAMFTDGKKSIDVSAQMGYLIGARGFEMGEQLNAAQQKGMQAEDTRLLRQSQVRAQDASAAKDVAYAGALKDGTKTPGGGANKKATNEIASFISADPMAKVNATTRTQAQVLAEHLYSKGGGQLSPQAAGGQGLTLYNDLLAQARKLVKEDPRFKGQKPEELALAGVKKITSQ